MNSNITKSPNYSAENIAKRFKSGDGYLDVLTGAELALESKQIAILSGPSGSGKSTLLYILGGLIRPDKGMVRFEGRSLYEIDQSSLDEFRSRSIGFVFQMHHLMPDFTAIENIIIPALVAGFEKNEALSRAIKILGQMGLESRKDHYPNQLSGGEQQRVAVARALINAPKFILADEPTGNLDSENAKSLLKLFRNLVENTDVGLLIATHDQELARTGDVWYKLVDGKISKSNSLAS